MTDNIAENYLRKGTAAGNSSKHPEISILLLDYAPSPPPPRLILFKSPGNCLKHVENC